MKPLFIFIFLILIGGFKSRAQNELVNIHLSKSEMHGGTQSSGVSTTLAYTFVSKKAIKMLNITFEEAPLLLDAKDTLIIYFITHRPYGGISLDNRSKIGEYQEKKSFASYYRNSAFHLSVNTKSEFKLAATYKYKKKKYVAKRKTEIDMEQQNYAP